MEAGAMVEVDHWTSIVRRRSLAVDHSSSITGRRSFVVDHWPSIISSRSLAVDHSATSSYQASDLDLQGPEYESSPTN
jgi:hypothetical protein